MTCRTAGGVIQKISDHARTSGMTGLMLVWDDEIIRPPGVTQKED